MSTEQRPDPRAFDGFNVIASAESSERGCTSSHFWLCPQHASEDELTQADRIARRIKQEVPTLLARKDGAPTLGELLADIQRRVQAAHEAGDNHPCDGHHHTLTFWIEWLATEHLIEQGEFAGQVDQAYDVVEVRECVRQGHAPWPGNEPVFAPG